MVQMVNRGYQCKVCRMIYQNPKWAKKCESWCRKNKSCNLEITNYAINKTKI